MPIRTTTMVDLREQIAMMALSGHYAITEIAELFGITRPTVYKYRDRYRLGGRAALPDRSRAPRSSHRTADWIVDRVIADRRRFRFGSKKIRRRMLDESSHLPWPARSTIDEILRREGLVKPRRRRHHYHSPFQRRYEPTTPGELDTIDFKGEFRLRDGRWCHPLTMADAVSRYLLACQALPSISLDGVWPVVERVFRDHGLPQAVLSDNGPPFGGHGLSRFSTFSVRLMELDIQPVFILPGHPEHNASHERMHRTLKESAALRPGRSFREQQRRFDAFRSMYNEERPHEGIDMDRPADRHRPSPRPFPPSLPPIQYSTTFEVRTVSGNGSIKWLGQFVFLSHALAGRRVGLERIDDHLCNVHFGSFLIGKLNERERRFL
jgi:transposase InsO family protein